MQTKTLRGEGMFRNTFTLAVLILALSSGLVGCGSNNSGGTDPNDPRFPFEGKAAGAFQAEKDASGNEIQISDTLADKFRKAGCSRNPTGYSIDPTLQVGQTSTRRTFDFTKDVSKQLTTHTATVEFVNTKRRAVRSTAIECLGEARQYCGYAYTHEFEITDSNNYRTFTTNHNDKFLQAIEHFKSQDNTTTKKRYRTHSPSASASSVVAGIYVLPNGQAYPAIKMSRTGTSIYALYDEKTDKPIGVDAEGMDEDVFIWTWVLPQIGDYNHCTPSSLVSFSQILDKKTGQPVQQSMSELLNFR